MGPDCYTIGLPDRELTLTVSNATIVEGITYTFGIGVLNPGESVEDEDNLWGLTLKDRSGSVVDSNRNVPGLPLKIFPAEVAGSADKPGLSWNDVMKGKTSHVKIDINFKEDIGPRRISEVLIMSPEGVMFSDPRRAALAFQQVPAARHRALYGRRERAARHARRQPRHRGGHLRDQL